MRLASASSRSLIWFAAALALAGCQTSPDIGTNAASVEVTDAGVLAFRDVCLGTAPGFADAQRRASSLGVTKFSELGTSRTGMTADKSLGVQIDPDRKCVVTTYSRTDANVRAQFAKVIGEAAGQPVTGIRTFPYVATLHGANFIFQHDRRGGEAYVMLRR